MKRKKVCEICQIVFLPNTPTQRFCGSTDYKTGCSWKKFIQRKKEKQSRYHTKKSAYIKSLEEEVRLLRTLAPK